MPKLSEDFKQSFHRLKPVIIADIGFLIAFGSLVINDAEWKISVRLIALVTVGIFTVSSFLIIILWDLLIAARKQHTLHWPRTVGAFPSGNGFIIVTQPSDIYFLDALVSIYYQEYFGATSFERHIGWGYVSHIQGGDQAIQITPLSYTPGSDSIWKNIQLNDLKVTSNVVCKLSIKLEDLRK